jgi:hypothetical protein
MTYPDNEWTRALRKGVEGAHDNMRYGIRLARQNPLMAGYYTGHAKAAHERACWYVARLRDQRKREFMEASNVERSAA